MKCSILFAFSLIHEIGGVCIADEVQTGLGRTGEYFWAFEVLNCLKNVLIGSKLIDLLIDV